jgi:hypothetical protein
MLLSKNDELKAVREIVKLERGGFDIKPPLPKGATPFSLEYAIVRVHACFPSYPTSGIKRIWDELA